MEFECFQMSRDSQMATTGLSSNVVAPDSTFRNTEGVFITGNGIVVLSVKV